MEPETSTENEEFDGNGRKGPTAPVRTKTGTVLLRMTNDQQRQMRRTVRRRTTNNKNNGRGDGEAMSEMDMSMIRESTSRKSQKHARTEMGETEKEGESK